MLLSCKRASQTQHRALCRRVLADATRTNRRTRRSSPLPLMLSEVVRGVLAAAVLSRSRPTDSGSQDSHLCTRRAPSQRRRPPRLAPRAARTRPRRHRSPPPQSRPTTPRGRRRLGAHPLRLPRHPDCTRSLAEVPGCEPALYDARETVLRAPQGGRAENESLSIFSPHRLRSVGNPASMLPGARGAVGMPAQVVFVTCQLCEHGSP